jgi:hypothetical protein
MFQELAQVIEQGKADGSIRDNLDAVKGAYAVAFSTTGFFRQLSETGDTFTGHFKLNQEEFSRFALDLLARALRA